MYEFQKGPEREVALKLAREVFQLADKLGIKYAQMAKESDLKVTQLSSLKANWVNKQEVTSAYMSPTLANGLIRFWNAHLRTPYPGNKGKSKKAFSKKRKATIKSAERKNTCLYLIIILCQEKTLKQIQGSVV